MVALAGCGGGSSPTTGSSPTVPPPGSQTQPGKLTTGDGRGGVRLQKLGDFDQPLYVAQAPGDRRDLFVVEQTGRVEVLTDRGVRPTPFLDLRDQVSCCGEQGLLSIAFAPDYERSGLVYADYTDRAGDTRVVEYRRSSSDPLVVAPASRRVVLRVAQPFPNHNGGLLMFGPSRARSRRAQGAGSSPVRRPGSLGSDSLLYVGLGDGGSEGDPDRAGQDLSTLLGKILRIDPRAHGGRPYTIPASNPFTGQAGARPEIYSYGLRNPWRFSFDRLTGDLSIGDVGQSRFEEIDLVARGAGRGANFGWSAYEGFARFNTDQSAPDAVPPVLAYSHDDGCSVTGGYVVRDPSLPSLYGRYLYGDYCTGELRSFPAAPGKRATDDRALGLDVPSLSSFGEDDAGHVYATSLEGPVYRLDPAR
jgi:glucose/arabinose dehydrogenase